MIFRADVYYVDSNCEEDKDTLLIAADSLPIAAKRLAETYSDLYKVTLEWLNDNDQSIVYLPRDNEDAVKAIVDENIY